MNLNQEYPVLLDRLVNTFQCDMDWDGMSGTERVRDCSQCKKQVFNVSEMSRVEAEAFLQENGVSQCIRLYQRSDGTIMTDECPAALRKIRNSVRAVKSSFSKLTRIAAIAFATCISGSTAFGAEPTKTIQPNHIMGKFVMRPNWVMPSLDQLKSGKHAMGDEVSTEGGAVVITVTEKPKDLSNKPEYRQVPSGPQKLAPAYGPGEATGQAEFCESIGMPKAAEAYFKLALKLVDANETCSVAFKKNAVNGYRKFLIKENRQKEADELAKEYGDVSQ